MAVRVIVVGLDELTTDLKKLQVLLKNPELITWQLALNMNKVVHIKTGYLKSTIYHKNDVAGADAPYAGYEEERGGTHAYATRAIEDFSMEKYADDVWKVFG